MNIIVRLFFLILGFMALYTVMRIIRSTESLTQGQTLLTYSLIPAALAWMIAVCHTEKWRCVTVPLVSIFLSLFLVLVCKGMYQTKDDWVYTIFESMSYAAFVISFYMAIKELVRPKPWNLTSRG